MEAEAAERERKPVGSPAGFVVGNFVDGIVRMARAVCRPEKEKGPQ